MYICFNAKSDRYGVKTMDPDGPVGDSVPSTYAMNAAMTHLYQAMIQRPDFVAPSVATRTRRMKQKYDVESAMYLGNGTSWIIAIGPIRITGYLFAHAVGTTRIF